MEEITYKGELIRKFSDGCICVYTMNPDGDIDETACTSMERAKEVIDNHILYMIEEGFAEPDDYKS